ncbi:class I SAM-dependent methyltransferase [bacterium]|nr:class I SAM-dependent methyltransferase [bacterium]
MQKRHKDRKQYFNEQEYTTQKYIIPFLNSFLDIKGIRVLEIGCGEGGNLLPFLKQGCKVVGVDLAKDKIANGKNYLSDYIDDKQCILYGDDVFNLKSLGVFDLIFYRDVIEHIPNHKKLLSFTYDHLDSAGFAFIAFPPWQNPFGGHQQMLNSFLGKVPFLHLLNKRFYRWLMEITRERPEVIEELLELDKSKVTLESFIKVVEEAKLKIIASKLYFINPNYEIKFKLKPRVLSKNLASLPYIRNYLSTTCYAVLKK